MMIIKKLFIIENQKSVVVCDLHIDRFWGSNDNYTNYWALLDAIFSIFFCWTCSNYSLFLNSKEMGSLRHINVYYIFRPIYTLYHGVWYILSASQLSDVIMLVDMCCVCNIKK